MDIKKFEDLVDIIDITDDLSNDELDALVKCSLRLINKLPEIEYYIRTKRCEPDAKTLTLEGCETLCIKNGNFVLNRDGDKLIIGDGDTILLTEPMYPRNRKDIYLTALPHYRYELKITSCENDSMYIIDYKTEIEEKHTNRFDDIYLIDKVTDKEYCICYWPHQGYGW